MPNPRLPVKRIHFARLAAGVLIGLAISSGGAKAQVDETFEVTNLLDRGSGSLRAAILAANASTADTKTITFDVSDNGTISLTSDLPDITDGVTIDGSTAMNLTIDGGGATRIFRVVADTTTVRDLALQNKPLEIGIDASLSFDVSADQQFDDVITDAGRLIKEGDATLTLRGDNNYTGGTEVREGTLLGDTTSLQGDIINNALLVFDQDAGVDGVYAGAITGTGAVQKTGADEVEFTGGNTYAGGTTISAGVLRGHADSLQGDIAVESGATVIFNQAGPDTYSGNLSGDGGFVKEGAGTLTLTGVNTISGQSSLDTGALTGDFSSIPLNLSTAGGTRVTFDHDDNGTYAGSISGMADVTKIGSGTLSLTGIHSFTRLTTVTGGRLDVDVDGLLAAGVDVGSSAVLGGTGTIGGSVTVDGTVAPGSSIPPGNSIGKLTVLGGITFASTSVFEVEVDEPMGVADHLMVTGAAILGGATLQVDPDPGGYLMPLTVTILTAGSISNDFAQPNSNFAFLKVASMKVGNTVELTIERNGKPLSIFAQTPNQSTIATALEAAKGPNSDIDTVFQSLNVLLEDQVPSVLDSMTGESLTQFATTRLATAERFGRLLDARILDHQWASSRALITAGTATGEASRSSADPIRPASPPVFGVAMLGIGPMGASAAETGAKADSWIRTWIDGSAIYGDVDGNANESGFSYNIWGGSLGADVRLAEHWVFGLAGGYANTDLDFSSRPGDGEVDTYQGALYAGYVDPRFHVGISGRYAYSDMDGRRQIRFGAINCTARADLDGHDYGARFEGGLNLLDLGGIVFQPTASVNYNRLTQDDVTESGAMCPNLAFEDFDLDSLVTGVGMRVRGRWKIADGFWIVPELRGRWLHEFLDTERLIEARLVGAPIGASAFQIQGVELPRDAGSVGLTWSVITSSAWSIIGSYDAVLNDKLVQHTGSVTLHLEW
ncbi:MAG: autotransporter domain-containing protein [Myxococcales bacterium]|nr:autotransporter domain-containing protein [Myxococcales bacterium]